MIVLVHTSAESHCSRRKHTHADRWNVCPVLLSLLGYGMYWLTNTPILLKAMFR